VPFDATVYSIIKSSSEAVSVRQKPNKNVRFQHYFHRGCLKQWRSIIEGPVREKNTYWLLLCIDTDRQTGRERERERERRSTDCTNSTRVQNCRLLNALRKYEPRWRSIRFGHTHAVRSAVVVNVYLMPKKPRAWSYRCRARTRHVCGRYIPAQQCYCCCCCCWRGRRWKAHRRIIVTASAALGRRSLRWQLRQDKTRRLHIVRTSNGRQQVVVELRQSAPSGVRLCHRTRLRQACPQRSVSSVSELI